MGAWVWLVRAARAQALTLIILVTLAWQSLDTSLPALSFLLLESPCWSHDSVVLYPETCSFSYPLIKIRQESPGVLPLWASTCVSILSSSLHLRDDCFTAPFLEWLPVGTWALIQRSQFLHIGCKSWTPVLSLGPICWSPVSLLVRLVTVFYPGLSTSHVLVHLISLVYLLMGHCLAGGGEVAVTGCPCLFEDFTVQALFKPFTTDSSLPKYSSYMQLFLKIKKM